MSEEELKDQINKIASKIMEVEEGAKKKEAYIENKINEEFNNKISEKESKIQVGQNRLDELNKNIDILNLEKKKLISFINDLKKQYNSLKKKKKGILNKEFKSIAKEKNNKMKTINREIKLLEKQLKEKEKL